MAGNNTLHHVKDDAQYVKFNPANTQWPEDVTNVQAALAKLPAHSINGVPAATETVAGIIEIASIEETDLGDSHSKAVTPRALKYMLNRPDATKTKKGIVRYATNDEAVSQSVDNVAISPDTLYHVMSSRKATESLSGTIMLSTMAAARAGTDDTTAVTPKKMMVVISEVVPGLVPEQVSANESREGLVRLATVGQALQGQVRDGHAISPYTFANSTGNESQAGTFKVASQVLMNAGVDDTTVVTPKKFAATKASVSQFGTVKLVDTINNAPNCALSSSARVLPLTGGVLSGDIFKSDRQATNRYATIGEVTGLGMPVGAIIITGWYGDRGNFMICDGRALSKSAYPELFAAIGYTHGGSGEYFNLPDTRGRVVRGVDGGAGRDPNRGFGTAQDDAMQRIWAKWVMDDQISWAAHGMNPQGAVAFDGNKVPYDAKSSVDWRNPAGWVMFDSARQTRTADETRMKNLALQYAIKVR